MRLIKKLKNKVEKAETKQATKEIIKDTGMEPTDEARKGEETERRVMPVSPHFKRVCGL